MWLSVERSIAETQCKRGGDKVVFWTAAQLGEQQLMNGSLLKETALQIQWQGQGWEKKHLPGKNPPPPFLNVRLLGDVAVAPDKFQPFLVHGRTACRSTQK